MIKLKRKRDKLEPALRNVADAQLTKRELLRIEIEKNLRFSILIIDDVLIINIGVRLGNIPKTRLV